MTEAVKTPWHLWAVGVVSLLWNAFGAFDYVMTKMGNAEYMAAFTPEQQAYFTSFPLWANVGWALGVWGSVLGSLLLLARSRHAVTAFLLSLVGLAISSIYQFGMHYSDLERMFGTFPMIFTAVIWVIVIALFLYARAQTSKGVLR
ncbi:hypothetical protein E5675_13440 [Sphingopyxis sp. PAMC25046]|uniref:hypothetical protein n=1 Tax=Sphingopyxis sp. PAMC25046 TaxID=2565556 RepID=UPI00109DC462|nr:hypothetical protein [Sphingopyxis sp. PAMC25046]QCB55334.1 hypothetical protein E5675_13440 [Sphingopyxis sp. PAMC25046]